MTLNNTELLNEVIQKLENFGVLSNIKNQLRTFVIQALENGNNYQDFQQKQPASLTKLVVTDKGRLAVSLLSDLLDLCDLPLTKSIFASEAHLSEPLLDRNSIIDRFSVPDEDGPLLVNLLDKMDSGDRRTQINLASLVLSEEQIMMARKKFDLYDKKTGFVDKSDLSALFEDVVPNFSRGILERFLSEQRITSYRVDFAAFLNLYRLLFTQCLQVVGGSRPAHSATSTTGETARFQQQQHQQPPSSYKQETNQAHSKDDLLQEMVDQRPKTSRGYDGADQSETGTVADAKDKRQRNSSPSFIPRLRTSTTGQQAKSFTTPATVSLPTGNQSKKSASSPMSIFTNSTNLFLDLSDLPDSHSRSDTLASSSKLRTKDDRPVSIKRTTKDQEELDEEWLTSNSMYDDITINSEFNLDADYIEDIDFPEPIRR